LLRALETVVWDTRAIFAMSLIVTLFLIDLR